MVAHEFSEDKKISKEVRFKSIQTETDAIYLENREKLRHLECDCSPQNI